MKRISSLPLLKFCLKSAELSAQHGAGRAAAKSTAFHALLADSKDAREKFLRLTSEEQSEIRDWKRPTDLVFQEGETRVILDFASAVKELRVAVTRHCAPCDPESPEAMIAGSLDFGWIREVEGKKIAYVGDIKKSRFTVEGPMTLQLLGYGFSFAALNDCDAFCPALWIAEDGEWIWGEMVDLDSTRAGELWSEVVAAATNDPTPDNSFATGPHCSGCYARLYCPEFVTGALKSEHLVSNALSGGITQENALSVLLASQALADIAEAAKQNIKEEVRRGLEIRQNGKKWGLKNMPGRESVSASDLRQGLGTEAERFIKRGTPYQQPGWVKA